MRAPAAELPYAWGEHVGELELHVWGASEREVFVDAARALAELMEEDDAPAGRHAPTGAPIAPAGRHAPTGEPIAPAGRHAPTGAPDAPAGGQVREVRVEGPDRALLLAAWLEELAFLAEVEGFVPQRVEMLELGPGGLQARVTGRHGAPPHLVKAVTHHRLAFAPAGGGGWRAQALLDV